MVWIKLLSGNFKGFVRNRRFAAVLVSRIGESWYCDAMDNDFNAGPFVSADMAKVYVEGLDTKTWNLGGKEKEKAISTPVVFSQKTLFSSE